MPRLVVPVERFNYSLQAASPSFCNKSASRLFSLFSFHSGSRMLLRFSSIHLCSSLVSPSRPELWTKLRRFASLGLSPLPDFSWANRCRTSKQPRSVNCFRASEDITLFPVGSLSVRSTSSTSFGVCASLLARWLAPLKRVNSSASLTPRLSTSVRFRAALETRLEFSRAWRFSLGVEIAPSIAPTETLRIPPRSAMKATKRMLRPPRLHRLPLPPCARKLLFSVLKYSACVFPYYYD